jgi:hypothetical protein
MLEVCKANRNHLAQTERKYFQVSARSKTTFAVFVVAWCFISASAHLQQPFL